MKFVILYFSGTGNTELIGREIKRRIERENHHVDFVSIEDFTALSAVRFTDAIIGFGYPVYKFTFPDNFRRIFPFLFARTRGHKYFQFCTYARFTADVFYDFSKKLKRAEYNLIAQECFKSPSNGISARKPEDDIDYRNVMFFEDDISGKLDDFADKILGNLDGKKTIVQKRPALFAPIRLKIVKSIEITKYPKLQIRSEVCIACGLCAKRCPDSNLIFHGDFIEVLDEKGCLHCLRCMHQCPVNAICFGKLTRGDHRYTLKKRDELFARSIGGYKEKYWADFDSIREEWRKNTIQYWRKHWRDPEV